MNHCKNMLMPVMAIGLFLAGDVRAESEIARTGRQVVERYGASIITVKSVIKQTMGVRHQNCAG
jgi:hypothetical protein